MGKRIVSLLCALLLLAIAGCSSLAAGGPSGGGTEENSIDFYALDTYVVIRAQGAGDELLEEARTLVETLDAALSVSREDSEIALLNATGEAALSRDTAYLLDCALKLCWETGGALDISVYPVTRAWGFPTGEYRVPGQGELDDLLEHVDFRRVHIAAGESPTATVPEGTEIDLAGLAEGYAGDRLAELLREAGVTSALLDLGSSIRTVGTKPDGTGWSIAVPDPAGSGNLGILTLADQAVASAGVSQQYFEDGDGNRWWSVIDPADGYPADNGLLSVTVVGDEGLYCAALARALFVLGPDAAESFWQAHQDFEMILVTDRETVRITPGLSGEYEQVSRTYLLETVDGAAGDE
ncbi:MAG: FAD:protein FMN transferase [Oscillospiraceae bacterium]|nr:FAD:protein FMN transferase [Oscillospiraceae bacterium]